MERFSFIVTVAAAHCGWEVSSRNRREAAEARATLEVKIVEIDAAERRARNSEETPQTPHRGCPRCDHVNRYSDGRYMSANSEFAKHFDAEVAIGRTIFEIDLARDRAAMKRLMRKPATDAAAGYAQRIV